MEDFTINEMQDMQRKLQDKYKEKWESMRRLSPVYDEYMIKLQKADQIFSYQFQQ